MATYRIPSRRTRRPDACLLPILLCLCVVCKTSAFYPPRISTTARCSSSSSSSTPLLAGPSGDSSDAPTTGKGRARLSGPKETGATNAVDSILTLLSSDRASIALGLIGITICLVNRIIHIDDYDAITSVSAGADALGRQARADLLAVFASGAILLNGVSKLDVTSALAESVVLEGTDLDNPSIYWDNAVSLEQSESTKGELVWALESILDATPAKTAVIMTNDGNGWIPVAINGIVPSEESLRQAIPDGRTTPILDRFLPTAPGGGQTKESYLPTLQALPGRVEFTYFPANTQEVLILPIRTGEEAVGGGDSLSAVLVLGSDTAKSCTPRDVAWAQVLASRVGEQLFT